MEKNICERCGRDNHLTEECLSRTDVTNKLIDDSIDDDSIDNSYIRVEKVDKSLFGKIITVIRTIGSNIKKLLEVPKIAPAPIHK
jgi:hypothetical protein